ncbi:MAG: exodeoxyribonuclease VII large subunit [Limnochordia bacterium]|jgi:exodeoxyribonuclease VII large subunit|nr:exodeoxyribonuclease VII large subunit [Bacillota bacterium]
MWPAEPKIWTVAEATRRIEDTLTADPVLQSILIRGEISNYKRHTSGHTYFTLKDAKARLRCVLFRRYGQALSFALGDGLEVVAAGRIGVYPPNGDYQLYVEQVFPAGEGLLHYAFQQLKEKLAAEGLFDPGRKRPLPAFPHRLGVVTSLQGAALRDIVTVARRRNPKIDIIVAPAIVQGSEGPASIIKALELCNRYGDLDIIILGRGGGSLEDLWSFNDEGVARAVYSSSIPVISAVGHETDVTITDLVADHRAPTPSAAAEMAVPDVSAIAAQLISLYERLRRMAQRRVDQGRRQVSSLAERSVLQRPEERLNRLRLTLDERERSLLLAVRNGYRLNKDRLIGLAGRLELLSPLGTLARGYSICQLSDGRILRRAQDGRVGDMVHIILGEGDLQAKIQKICGEGSGGS